MSDYCPASLAEAPAHTCLCLHSQWHTEQHLCSCGHQWGGVMQTMPAQHTLNRWQLIGDTWRWITEGAS